MSNNTSEFLDSSSLSLDGLKRFLERDNLYVHRVNSDQETPLLRILKNYKCSIDMVQLLLDFHSDINRRNTRGMNSLHVALWYSKKVAIIKLLMEKGALLNNIDYFQGQSLICVAFDHPEREEVVKLLLDAGCSPHACKKHDFLLMHCAVVPGEPWEGFTQNFLQFLINLGAELNKVDAEGRSPLCSVLKRGYALHFLELLMKNGASLHACKKHASPLLCVTCTGRGRILTADIIGLLLRKSVCCDKVFDYISESLQRALKHTFFETKAIQLLLDFPGFDAKSVFNHGGNLLHYAITAFCPKIIVQLLIDRGVRLDEVNYQGETPLHRATLDLYPYNIGLEIIEIIQVLLENGSPVNTKSKKGETPLRLAMEDRDIYTFQLLFAAGASISLSNYCNKISLLKLALNNYRKGSSRWLYYNNFKIVLKCSFLEDHDFNIEDLLEENSEFHDFANECTRELQRMDSQNVGHGHTLREFVTGYYFPGSIPDSNPKVTSYDLNQLLKVLASNAFPIYFDMIVVKIGKEKLQETLLCAVNHHLGSTNIEKQVGLNFKTICDVTEFLHDEELMNWILAFF